MQHPARKRFPQKFLLSYISRMKRYLETIISKKMHPGILDFTRASQNFVMTIFKYPAINVFSRFICNRPDAKRRNSLLLFFSSLHKYRLLIRTFYFRQKLLGRSQEILKEKNIRWSQVLIKGKILYIAASCHVSFQNAGKFLIQHA